MIFKSVLVPITDGISLDQLICRRQPRLCQDESYLKKEANLPLTARNIPMTDSQQSPSLPKTFLKESTQDLPSRPTDFSRWEQYGKVFDDGTGYGSGTGLAYGRGVAPGDTAGLSQLYGPGLGDVAVRTGVGVQYPFGSLGVRRDFEIGFGGSGRIGGIPFGYGNGYAGNGLGMSQSGWPHDRPFTNGDIWPLG